MDKALVRDYLQKALAELDRPDLISTPDQLDTAISSGVTSLVLSNSLRYFSPLTIPKGVSLIGEGYATATGRVTVDEPLPTFLGGITLLDMARLRGVEVRQPNPLTTIVTMAGIANVLDRVRVMGDPVKGAHRGVNFAGASGTIENCWIDDIFQPAQDTQAIGAFDCGPGLLIDNCYLCAAGQSIMFGGADPTSVDRVPSDVTITNSTLTKKPEWLTTSKQQVKCALELKNVIGLKMDNCRLEYAGTSMGQGAFLIVATPRNQGGKAPFSAVKDVTITNCTGAFAAGILNCLGSDNVNPSGPLDNLVVKDCTFTDIDPLGVTKGSGRLFQFDRKPSRISLSGLTVGGKNLKALGYFIGGVSGLVMEKLVLPTSTYGWKIDAGGSGRKALLVLMPDALFDASVL